MENAPTSFKCTFAPNTDWTDSNMGRALNKNSISGTKGLAIWPYTIFVYIKLIQLEDVLRLVCAYTYIDNTACTTPNLSIINFFTLVWQVSRHILLISSETTQWWNLPQIANNSGSIKVTIPQIIWKKLYYAVKEKGILLMFTQTFLLNL